MNSFDQKCFVHVLCNDITDNEGISLRMEKAIGLITFDEIVTKVECIDDSSNTRWHFADECPPWFSYSSSLNKIEYYLTGISSLKKEGLYCSVYQKWKRNYVTRDGKLTQCPH